MAEGNVASLKESGKNDVFNLAGDELVTINQVVANLKGIFGQIDLEYKPLRPSDFKGVKVSIEKAKKTLSWKPKTSFEKGLRKYVEYVRSNPSPKQ